MQEKKIHTITVGSIATNCWIYPLNEAEAAADTVTTASAANAVPGKSPGLPDGFSPCAVIDPGEEGSRIIAFLDQHKFFPQYILLTHGHFDHIAAVPALAAHYEAAVIAIHEADAEYLGPDSYPVHCRSFTAAAGSPTYIDALWEEQPPPTRTLAEGDAIGPFAVLHLPGHTPGSIGLWDQKAGVLFSGDTLFCGDYGRTDLPGGNEAQLFASLKRLFAMDSGIRVCPGHGPPTTIGREAAQMG